MSGSGGPSKLDARGMFAVLLGAYYAPDGPPHDIFYDDVSITILP